MLLDIAIGTVIGLSVVALILAVVLIFTTATMPGHDWPEDGHPSPPYKPDPSEGWLP